MRNDDRNSVASSETDKTPLSFSVSRARSAASALHHAVRRARVFIDTSHHLRARLDERALWLYAHASEGKVFKHPVARRTVECAYLGYKFLIEASTLSPLRSIAVPGSTVIDVGANIGFFSVRFGRWVGPDGHVIAIEPEAQNMATLRRRVRRAGLQQTIDCVEAVAADRPGEMRLALQYQPGAHRIAAAGKPVSAVTLDDLTMNEPRRVALIKIDVQGAEMMVLTGARRVIEMHRPAIIIEVDDHALQRFEASAREMITLFADLGYRGHTLMRRGLRAWEAPEALIAHTANFSTDVLFLPQASRLSGG